MDKKNIEAIHEHDLDKFLENLGILEQINNAELLCTSCGIVIKRENLGIVASRDKRIKVACSRIECISKLET